MVKDVAGHAAEIGVIRVQVHFLAKLIKIFENESLTQVRF